MKFITINGLIDILENIRDTYNDNLPIIIANEEGISPVTEVAIGMISKEQKDGDEDIQSQRTVMLFTSKPRILIMNGKE